MTRDIDETCIKRRPNRADYDRSSERRPRKGSRKERSTLSTRITHEELILSENQDCDQNETLEERDNRSIRSVKRVCMILLFRSFLDSIFC